MSPQQIITKLESLGLTQTQISQKTQLSQSSISLIKNGKRKEVKHSTYKALKHFLVDCEKNFDRVEAHVKK